jgi:hypothetical protein
MRLSLLALLVCFAALISACGGGYEPGEDAVAVRIQEEYDESRGLYAEGSFSYVRVERLNGDELLEVRLEDGKADFRIEPGAYRFVSYQRVCEGNCDSLDHPSDECQRVIPVEREMEVRIFAGAGMPCRLAPQ